MYVESLNYVFHNLYCTTCSKVVALRKNRCQNGRTLVRIGAGRGAAAAARPENKWKNDDRAVSRLLGDKTTL